VPTRYPLLRFLPKSPPPLGLNTGPELLPGLLPELPPELLLPELLPPKLKLPELLPPELLLLPPPELLDPPPELPLAIILPPRFLNTQSAPGGF
jgi:hypothetical protein